jgi:hypothetical protein
MGLSRAPTKTTNAKPSSHFLQCHGAVPALLCPVMPNLPRSQSCRCHITSHPEGENADCCHIVHLRAGAALGRIRVSETQSTFDVWLPTYERDRDVCIVSVSVSVSVVQFIYLTLFFFSHHHHHHHRTLFKSSFLQVS